MRYLFSFVQLPLERSLRVEFPVPWLRRFHPSSTPHHSSPMHEISHRFVLHCFLLGLVGIRLPVPIHLEELHGRLRPRGWHLLNAMRKVRSAFPTCSSYTRDRRQRTFPNNPSVIHEVCPFPLSLRRIPAFASRQASPRYAPMIQRSKPAFAVPLSLRCFACDARIARRFHGFST